MVELPVSDIEMDPAIQIRDSNDEETIQRYMDSFEQLPPIDVFETAGGVLVADGFHRLAAAIRLGRPTIGVTMHRGTYNDAAEFAATANVRNGRQLTKDERNRGIQRLKQIHGDAWSQGRIAKAMGVSQPTVSQVLRLDEFRRNNHSPEARQLPDESVQEVLNAHEDDHQPLIDAAVKRGWSREATRQAVRNLDDDRVPEERKESIRAGEADPVVITANGELTVTPDIVGRRLKEAQANDAVLAIDRFLQQGARLMMFRPDVIAATAGDLRSERLKRDLPAYIEFLQDVHAHITRSTGLELVQ